MIWWGIRATISIRNFCENLEAGHLEIFGVSLRAEIYPKELATYVFVLPLNENMGRQLFRVNFQFCLLNVCSKIWKSENFQISAKNVRGSQDS